MHIRCIKKRLFHLTESRVKPFGSSIVEFALLLPIFALIILGMTEVSLAIYNKTLVTNIGRDSARFGTLVRTPRASEEEIEAFARTALEESLLFYSSQGTTLSVIRPDLPTSGDRLVVVIRHEYQGIGLGRLIATLAGPIIVSSASVMSYE